MRRLGPWLSKKLDEKLMGVERIAQPGAGVSPFLSGGINRDPQGRGNLLVTQAGELAQLDYLRSNSVLVLQLAQGFVERQQPIVLLLSGDVDGLNGLATTATL